jgi:carbon-monoxide dehydrogenase medium subunit
MQTFAYQRPATVHEAVAAATAADTRLIAGGQSLLPAMKLGLASPQSLVDLGAIAELKGIVKGAAGLTIGAMTTHAAVAESTAVLASLPALAALAGNIGDRQVRQRGTIGGSLANNDPAADWPAAVLGLGATITTDRRTIAADDYFRGMFDTALEEGELIASITFPLPQRAAWHKFKQPASRFSLVGVFVSQGPAGVRVAVTGAGPGVFRVPALEARLAASWSAASCLAVAVSAKGLVGDLHGSAEYRAGLIPVLAARAVEACA